jgi:hypothetical protein
MMRLATLAAVLLALPAPAGAANAPFNAPQQAASAAYAAALARLQANDARVLSIGWRLVRGNAPYCRDAAPAVGLLLLDAAGFENPGATRAALGLTGDLAVGAVAEGAPASRAGLRPNLTLNSVAGVKVSSLPNVKAGDYARLAMLHDRVDAVLRRDGLLDLVLADGTRLTIAGESACPSRFEVLSSGDRAAADGKRIALGRALIEDLPEDELLAAVLAHELAHNLLGHRARLDLDGRSWGKIKTTEREADRLSVWLLANAGYDPRAAIRFFQRWGPKHDYGIFATPDHDRWQTRIKRIEAELVRLEAARRVRGTADWSRDFRASLKQETRAKAGEP